MHVRGSRRQRAVALWVGLSAMLVAVLFSTAGYARDMEVKRFRIESVPDGAVVSTITGKRGVTPLSITERDIYPNTYSPEKIDLYGKVVISKTGCKTVTRRVTLDDIKQGIDIRLDCTAPGTATKAPANDMVVPRPEQSVTKATPATTATESLSARRLRQLKVLHELLQDGLISSEEEQAIRQRIYERLQ